MLRLRLLSLFRKNRVDHELDAELRFHLEKQIAANIASGMSPAEARSTALRTFGGVEQIKEECRDARGVVFIETMIADIRYGLRTLRRSPTFTAVAVLSLALGIGANTAIFTLIDAVLIKMLPVKKPEQLVVITWGAKEWPRDIMNGHRGNTWGSAGHVGGTSFSFPNANAKHGEDHRGHQPVQETHRNCELLPLGGHPRFLRTSEGVIALGFFVSPARLVNDCE